MPGFATWIYEAPVIVIGAASVLIMVLTAALGAAMRRWVRTSAPEENEGEQGYMVSAVLGLLALLIGFTFSMAVDRFDARRGRVLEEANAIGTTYLRAQLLEEPHRARISRLLVEYTDNRLALGRATHMAEARPLLETNDRLITDLWTATHAAFPSVSGLDFSSTFIESMNNLIDLDAARKAARNARVPLEVLVVLFVYLVVSSGVLGYVLTGRHGRAAAAFVVLLLVLSLMMIIDLNRPTSGWVREGQGPMEALQASLRNRPPEVFDRWDEEADGR